MVGALVIAVIQNGMNLTGVESYTQNVVLGLVILGAVLFDNLREARVRSFNTQPRHSVSLDGHRNPQVVSSIQ